MAYIDKIYGTKAQYDEFRDWCRIKKPEALKQFYTWESDGADKQPITNFSSEIDYWMFFNCPIKFVTDRILEQYSLEHLLNKKETHYDSKHKHIQ